MIKFCALMFVAILSAQVFGQEQGKPKVSPPQSGNPSLDYADWILSEGRAVQDQEEKRVRKLAQDPDFVRNELIEEYILVKVRIAFKRRELVFFSSNPNPDLDFKGNMDFREKYSKSLEDEQAKALRILELLSRIPPPQAKRPER